MQFAVKYPATFDYKPTMRRKSSMGKYNQGRTSFTSLIISASVSMELERYEDGLTTVLHSDDDDDGEKQSLDVERSSTTNSTIRRSWLDLQRISLLGQGVYSNVYLVVDPNTRTEYALKCLDASRIANSKGFLDAAIDLAREAALLARFDHENIIQLRGICSTPLSESYQEDGNGFFFLLDVLQETLKDRLHRWRADKGWYQKALLGPRLERLRFGFNGPSRSMNKHGYHIGRAVNVEQMHGRIETVALGIVRGMRYLHEQQNIVMRDLKPANIGFDAGTGQVRLFDFGMSRDVRECISEDVVGTPRYMAPEVMICQGTSFASDVYSFGVVLFELCSLTIAFSKERSLKDFQKHVVDTRSRPNLWCIPCVALQSLIARCWAHDPNDRPTFEEIHQKLLETFLDRHQSPDDNKCSRPL